MMRILTPHGPNEIEWDSDYNLVLAPGAARGWSAPSRSACTSPASPPSSDTLAGTALETVETVGRGSVTVFGYEPNFRAVADGSARLLREAILGTPTGSVPWTTPQRPLRRSPRAHMRSDVLGPSPHASLASGPRQVEAWWPAQDVCEVGGSVLGGQRIAEQGGARSGQHVGLGDSGQGFANAEQPPHEAVAHHPLEIF